MREESHLDDMRAAIRGDFERLEERRGEQELMRPAERKVETEAPPEVESQGEAEQAGEPIDEAAAASPYEASDDVPDERPGSWLDRLLGR